MTLVDTSVWIDWHRGRLTPQTRRLDALLVEGRAAVAPVILQELLQGAVDATWLRKLRKRYERLPMYRFDPLVLHAEAGALYARCRWAGITPRSPHDCLIAVTALAADVPLLHDDADFLRIAAVEPRLRLLA